MTDFQALLENVSDEDIQTELMSRSMYEFIKGAWATLEPGRQFYDNWHIEAICEHLEAVSRGELQRLIINIPPRHMKSLTCAVAFPCWTWINKPHTQFLFASYAQPLSTRDSVKCRRLLTSPWYLKNWPDSFKITTDQNQKQRFENDHNGHRISTSVRGGMTGEGGDIIVIDDPHNVKEAESEQTRQSTLEWWDTVVPTRINDPKSGAFVIIMQRVHQQDLTGHILRQAPGDWTHLCVPAEYEKNHPHLYVSTLPNPKNEEDPRTEENELLWEERIPKNHLDRLKGQLGMYASAGQLQQRPSPKGGGILKEEWWRLWEEPKMPDFVYVLQSWDTAYSERSGASHSACTTWGVFPWASRYAIMIMGRYRARVPYPELRKMARELYDDFAPDAVIIEKKSSGQALIKDLQMMGIPALPYLPERDKVARAHAVSPLLESGVVWYPDRRWAKEVIQWCSVFPAGDGADIVDTLSQALIRLRHMWYAEPPEDEQWDPKRIDRDDPMLDNIIVLDDKRSLYG